MFKIKYRYTIKGVDFFNGDIINVNTNEIVHSGVSYPVNGLVISHSFYENFQVI